ncbi:MAG: hypothetical protein ACK42Z_02540, partial [Candidatus Kapaibacteriota bacterium]
TPIDFNFDFDILLIIPDVQISTKFAYSLIPYSIRPRKPTDFVEVINMINSLDDFKQFFVNDFEDYIFNHYKSLPSIKEKLYNLGARFASLTGSGAAIFGIFLPNETLVLENSFFPNCISYLTNIF